MKVSPGVASERLCPSCGVPRVGAFRFCRGCGLDFDQGRPPRRGGVGGPTPHVILEPTTTPPATRWGSTGEPGAWPETPVAVGPGRPTTGMPAPTISGSTRARAPIATGSHGGPRVGSAGSGAMPTGTIPSPPSRSRLPQLPWSLGIEPADRRTILLGIVVGTLAGLGVVVVMALLASGA